MRCSHTRCQPVTAQSATLQEAGPTHGTGTVQVSPELSWNGLQVQELHPAASRAILLDLPGLLFFSTYTLLVLFWAEIYHQARSLPTSSLRPAFLGLNAGVYAVQVQPVAMLRSGTSGQLLPVMSSAWNWKGFPPAAPPLCAAPVKLHTPAGTPSWAPSALSAQTPRHAPCQDGLLMQAGLWAFLAVSGLHSVNLSRVLSCSFLAIVSLLAAASFLLYGGRLFLMLRRCSLPSQPDLVARHSPFDWSWPWHACFSPAGSQGGGLDSRVCRFAPRDGLCRLAWPHEYVLYWI